MRRAELILATIALIAIPIVGGGRFIAWHLGPFAHEGSREQLERVAPEEKPEDGFVASGDCSSCHAEAYRAWHKSYHRTMTQMASPEAVLGDFDGVELTRYVEPRGAEDQGHTERYRLSETNGEHWATLLGTGPGVPDQHSRIVMTTGSHEHQIVWVWGGRNRELFHLPFTWLVAEGRWIPRTDSFLAPPDDPSGDVVWSSICVECHSTNGQPRIKGDEPADSRVVELGIACESCHGAAGAHVAANRPPWSRYMKRGEEDPTIVNPERLSASLATDVCGRCHSVLSQREPDPWQGRWNEFQPGEPLESEGRVLLRPASTDPFQRQVVAEHSRQASGRFPRDRFWEDGAVRVAGRETNDVVASPCFKGGEFSCLSCHSMHQYEDVDDQLAPEMRTDKVCTQCHENFATAATAHTGHAANSAGSRCANCHMPYTTYGLLKAIRSHRVSNPSVAAEVATGRPNACNACHLDRTLSWTQDQLVRQYGIAPVELDDTARHVAAGPRWMATGDAGVRALAAWYSGWQPARAASGNDWQAPYLAELLSDDYSAVRSIAGNSIHTLKGFAELEYDFVKATGEVGATARSNVREAWLLNTVDTARPGLGPLISFGAASGRPRLDYDAWELLMEARDDRPIALIE
ncbi:MAG: putative CXXCH cytochrome family protein [Hyphomicrobiaceae bacterium]